MSTTASAGGDIASRLTLTSEDEDETGKDGPFFFLPQTKPATTTEEISGLN